MNCCGNNDIFTLMILLCLCGGNGFGLGNNGCGNNAGINPATGLPYNNNTGSCLTDVAAACLLGSILCGGCGNGCGNNGF